MQKRIKRILCLLCALWLCAGVGVQASHATEENTETIKTISIEEDAKEPSEKGVHLTDPFWEAGDVVGFIGDSITHVEYSSINYVEFLYNYFLSHFPNEEYEFRNLGVSSYKASDILNIYDRDKGFEGLDKAVILLGMNEALQKETTETYITNMEKLVGLLKEDGLEGDDILVLSPTPYDQTCTANFDSKGNPYRKSDDLLTDYTKALAQKTQEWGVRYVDLHTPMLELTAEIQKESTDRTLTIWDCVHPDAMGQMVMAHEILKAQGATALISQIVIPAEGEALAANASVTDLYRNEQGLCWNLKSDVLPMAMTYEFQEFIQLYDLVDQLNQMPLQIDGLKDEVSYTVTMGNETLGTFTGKELAEGINLAVLENNPLQKAMQSAEELNQQWHPNSAEYRKIVRYATMAEPTHTEEQMQDAYKSWRNTDLILRDGMYEAVQTAVKQTYRMTVVEEGYTAEALEQAAAQAAEQARIEAENAAKEAEAKAQAQEEEMEAQNGGMGIAGKIFLIVCGLSAAAAAAIGILYYLKQKRK